MQWLQSRYDDLQAYLYERNERTHARRLAIVEDVLAEATKDLQNHKRILALRENPLYQKQRPFNPKTFAHYWSHTYPVRQNQTPDDF